MAGAILRTRSVAEIGYSPESAPNLAEIAAESAGNNPSCTCRWKLLYGHSQSPRHSCIERLSACAALEARASRSTPRGDFAHPTTPAVYFRFWHMGSFAAVHNLPPPRMWRTLVRRMDSRT